MGAQGAICLFPSRPSLPTNMVATQKLVAWHATHVKHVHSIKKNGFKPSVTGRLGKGIYFAKRYRNAKAIGEGVYGAGNFKVLKVIIEGKVKSVGNWTPKNKKMEHFLGRIIKAIHPKWHTKHAFHEYCVHNPFRAKCLG